eukprot:gene32335-39922_t
MFKAEQDALVQVTNQAPGLALDGPIGSMARAVDGMKAEQGASEDLWVDPVYTDPMDDPVALEEANKQRSERAAKFIEKVSIAPPVSDANSNTNSTRPISATMNTIQSNSVFTGRMSMGGGGARPSNVLEL